MPSISATRVGEIAAEKAGILKRGVPAIVAAQPREALAVIERQAARVKAPHPHRRRGLDGHRGARPPGLSGRCRSARSAGAEAVRPPSVRECRRRHRRAARRQRAQAAAAAFETGIAKADWPARMQRLSHGALAALRAGRRASCGSTAATTPTAAAPSQRARRSRGAGVAAAGAGRRHAVDQGQRGIPEQFHRPRAPHHRGADPAAGEKPAGRRRSSRWRAPPASRPRAVR